MRIVSLVPSLSETLCSLGLKDQIVGCTKFCVHPQDLYKESTMVGGTKDPSLSVIEDLKPDIIFANTEENRAEDIDACKSIATTIETFPKGPGDVPAMLAEMAAATKTQHTAKTMIEHIHKLLDLIEAHRNRNKDASFLYFIWKNPFMFAGTDTYISQNLEVAGFKNLITAEQRYPALELKSLKDLDPDLLLLSTEPYPFRQRDAQAILQQWPDAPPIYKIDGRLLSWYGTATIDCLKMLLAWQQPDSWLEGCKRLDKR